MIRIRVRIKVRDTITVLDYCIKMAEMIMCTGRYRLNFSIEKFGYYPLCIM